MDSKNIKIVTISESSKNESDYLACLFDESRKQMEEERNSLLKTTTVK